jgi:transcriptional regulator with XRE-family HTH domain
MSQRGLSEASGARQADISRIERGAGNPTEGTLQRLALALDKRLELRPTTGPLARGDTTNLVRWVLSPARTRGTLGDPANVPYGRPLQH